MDQKKNARKTYRERAEELAKKKALGKAQNPDYKGNSIKYTKEVLTRQEKSLVLDMNSGMDELSAMRKNYATVKDYSEKALRTAFSNIMKRERVRKYMETIERRANISSAEIRDKVVSYCIGVLEATHGDDLLDSKAVETVSRDKDGNILSSNIQKNKAVDVLARIAGLYIDRSSIEISGQNGGAIEVCSVGTQQLEDMKNNVIEAMKDIEKQRGSIKTINVQEII